MANTTTTTTGGASPFHKVGLTFGSAGALVRLTAGDRLYAVAAAWVRTRKGSTDKVFYTLPQQLLGPAEELVKCEVLSGDLQSRRFNLVIRPEERICNTIENTSDGGSYGVIYMDRIGQAADFQSMMYRLDGQWRLDRATAQPIANLAKWLHEDFLGHAQHIPSAWPIMYAAAALFGGQEQTQLDKLYEGTDAAPPQLPADLAVALDDERRFRANSRRARALSPAQIEAFRKSLSPDQNLAFDALLEGRRTYA